jgi:hypothetical protein
MFNVGSNQIEMGYTLNEFSNVLHGNFSAQQSVYRCKDLSQNSWLISHERGSLQTEIRVIQKPPRKLGLLNLPVLGVTFRLISGDSQDEQQFFEKFFRYFHKGGG